MWVGGGQEAMRAWPENSASSGSSDELTDRRTRYSPWSRQVASSLMGISSGFHLGPRYVRQYELDLQLRICLKDPWHFRDAWRLVFDPLFKDSGIRWGVATLGASRC